jgi:hypothetical protein
MFPELEALTHPWKEVCQRIVSALDTFGNTGTSARKRQCTNAIRPEDHVRIRLGEASLWREDISRTLIDATAHSFATFKEL